MTPELSLEVLGLSLETRNCTEDERQHLRTRREHADKPAPAWGCFWSARKKPMSRQLPFTCWHTAGPGTMGQSFVSREEARNAASLSLCGQAVSSCYDCIAFTEYRHWHLCTVLFASYFTFRRKTLLNQGSHGVLHKWLTFDLSELCMESHQQRGLFQG